MFTEDTNYDEMTGPILKAVISGHGARIKTDGVHSLFYALRSLLFGFVIAQKRGCSDITVNMMMNKVSDQKLWETEVTLFARRLPIVDPPNPEVLEMRVAFATDPRKLAGSIAAAARQGHNTRLVAVGAETCMLAVAGLVQASRFLYREDIHIGFQVAARPVTLSSGEKDTSSRTGEMLLSTVLIPDLPKQKQRTADPSAQIN
jgi:stage V sporulation protein SpoVS